MKSNFTVTSSVGGRLYLEAENEKEMRFLNFFNNCLSNALNTGFVRMGQEGDLQVGLESGSRTLHPGTAHIEKLSVEVSLIAPSGRNV